MARIAYRTIGSPILIFSCIILFECGPHLVFARSNTSSDSVSVFFFFKFILYTAS